MTEIEQLKINMKKYPTVCEAVRHYIQESDGVTEDYAGLVNAYVRMIESQKEEAT